MIEITRRPDGITITGHAGYAEPGSDIVCAAISALTEVFVTSVDKLTADQITSDIRAGNAVIRYGNLSEHAQLLANSFFLGCEMIAKEYPQHVRIVRAVDLTLKATGEQDKQKSKKFGGEST